MVQRDQLPPLQQPQGRHANETPHNAISLQDVSQVFLSEDRNPFGELKHRLPEVGSSHLPDGNQHQGDFQHEDLPGAGFDTESGMALESPDQKRMGRENEQTFGTC